MKMMWWQVMSCGALIMLLGGCMHAERREMLRTATVSLADAVRMAEASVIDSRAVEAELEQKDGRSVYEVELIDVTHKTRKVYVDARNGQIMRIR